MLVKQTLHWIFPYIQMNSIHVSIFMPEQKKKIKHGIVITVQISVLIFCSYMQQLLALTKYKANV